MPTPADCLNGSNKSREIPKPKFQIGDKVTWDTSHPCYKENREFYNKEYLYYLIKNRRGRKKGRLSDHVKQNLILKPFNAFANSLEMEVAGIFAKGMHSFDNTMYNECYIGGVPGASSPMRFNCQLLVRWTNEKGNQMAMVTGSAVVGEDSLVKV